MLSTEVTEGISEELAELIQMNYEKFPPIDIDDESLREFIEDTELPSLLAALAYTTGNLDLVSPDLKPPHTKEAWIPLKHGGMNDKQINKAKQLAFDAIKTFRDNGSVPSDRPSEDALEKIVSFLISKDIDEYRSLLMHELALDGDPGAPKWSAKEFPGGTQTKVLVIGAGVSGLALGRRLKQAGVHFDIIERNPEVGGTWWDNRYPGCRLDTHNYAYSLSFAQKPDWPQQFSKQIEIQKYLEQVSYAFSLRENIRFNSSVTAMRFDEESKLWHVAVTGPDGEEQIFTANFVVSAIAQLSEPSIPNIPGLDGFKGTMVHSARWTDEIDVSNKRVAIIGTGASAYQIAPEIACQVANLTVFQRSAPWALPTPNYHDDINEGTQWLFKHVPYFARWFRFWQLWIATEGRMPSVTVDPGWNKPGSVSAVNEQFRQELIARYEENFADRKDLLPKIIPNYPAGAKRMLRDNGVWAKTLKRDNVELVTTRIASVSSSGVRTDDDVEREFDIIVFATGFKAEEHLKNIEVRGRANLEIHEYWDGDSRAYATMTVPHFPNLFLMSGPNTAVVANGSGPFLSECQLEYIVESIRVLLSSGYRSMEPTQEALMEFSDSLDAANRLRAWGVDGVDNWYKNKKGRASQSWPLEMLDYWNMTRAPDQRHYIFE